MKEVYVSLPTVRDVQRFVGTLVPLVGEFELISGQFVLDARSLMGIFGFDLSKPLCLRIHHDTKQNLEAIQPFMVGEESMEHE